MKANSGGEPKSGRALLAAVFQANVASVRTLIGAGADVNVCISPTSRAHMGASMGTVGKTPLGIAITERANESNYLDLSGSGEPGASKREEQATQKRAALLEIMEELARAGADLNLFSTFRLARSPLHVAAASNDVEAIELLLRHGARAQGTGALHEAALQGHVETVKALLAAGLDINEQMNGLTALQLLKERAQNPESESKWVFNFGPEYERQEAERKRHRLARREQIIQILEAVR